MAESGDAAVLSPDTPPRPAETIPPRISWKLLGLLMAVTGIGSLGVNMLTPAIPSLAATFKTTPAQAQLTITAFLGALAVAQLLLGALSDRIGRRPVLVAGLAVSAVAAAVAVFATSIDALVIARIAQAFGGATGVVVGRAIIRDLASRDQTAGLIGLVTTVMIVSPMVAPVIGGGIDTFYGWTGIFLFQAIFAGILFIWAALVLPETLAARSHEGSALGNLFFDLKALSRSVPFWCYALCGPLTCGPFYVYLGGSPHAVVTMLGRSSAEFGFWSVLPALGYMIGNAFCTRLSPRYGIDRVMRWGMIILNAGTVITVIALTFAPPAPIWQVSAYFLPQLIITFGNGLVMPNTIAGAVSIRPQAAGTAAGIVGFMQMGVGALIAQHASFIVASADSLMPLGWLSLIYTLAAAIPVMILAWLAQGAKEQAVRPG